MQVDIIASQGILELFILVAALRLHRKGHITVNFEQLWAEYEKTRGMQHADIYSKPASARAFQRLVDAALLAFSGSRYASTPRTFEIRIAASLRPLHRLPSTDCAWNACF